MDCGDDDGLCEIHKVTGGVDMTYLTNETMVAIEVQARNPKFLSPETLIEIGNYDRTCYHDKHLGPNLHNI